MADNDTRAVVKKSGEDTEQREEQREEQRSLLPAVDVFEDATGITLCADLPGVPKDQLTVHIHDNALTIEGPITLGEPEGMEAVHAEVTLPRYRREFTLSKELDTEKVEARFETGVLKLRIPKAQHVQPRRIEVQVG